MKTTKTYTTDENGLYTNFTKEDTLKFKQELKESGNCPMNNPEFYELWKWDNPNEVEDEETKRLERERCLKVREQVRNDLYKHRR